MLLDFSVDTIKTDERNHLTLFMVYSLPNGCSMDPQHLKIVIDNT